MAMAITEPRATRAGISRNITESQPAMRSAPPVAWIVSDTGIRAATSTRTGPSRAP